MARNKPAGYDELTIGTKDGEIGPVHTADDGRSRFILTIEYQPRYPFGDGAPLGLLFEIVALGPDPDMAAVVRSARALIVDREHGYRPPGPLLSRRLTLTIVEEYGSVPR